MPTFAQTNIALFKQMLSAETYGVDDVELVAGAYRAATPLFVGQFRGSGKPLYDHLVGTASILAAMGRPATTVAAGLLHAAHADGDFGLLGGASVRDARLERAVGPEVTGLLRAYADMTWTYDHRSLDAIRDRLRTMSDAEREVLRIRLANELEDLIDGGIAYCGSAADGPGRRKSAPWRTGYLREHGPALVQLAGDLGDHDLAAWLAEAMEENLTAHVPPTLRSGRVAMHLVPPSPGLRSRWAIRTGFRKVLRARELGVRRVVSAAVEAARRATGPGGRSSSTGG